MRFTLPKLFFAVTMAALACAGLTMRARAAGPKRSSLFRS